MRPLRLPPAVLGSLIVLLFASVLGLILAGRPDRAILAHIDVATIGAEALEAPDWRTVVLFSERETDLPLSALQAKIAAVDGWSAWSRSQLRVSERVYRSGSEMIRIRIDLLFGLLPLEYTAPIRTETSTRLAWGQVQPGAATLFAWTLTPVTAGRTRVAFTAYLSAPAYGALRAVLEAEGQAEIDRILTHLLTAAR